MRAYNFKREKTEGCRVKSRSSIQRSSRSAYGLIIVSAKSRDYRGEMVTRITRSFPGFAVFVCSLRKWTSQFDRTEIWNYPLNAGKRVRYRTRRYPPSSCSCSPIKIRKSRFFRPSRNVRSPARPPTQLCGSRRG